MRKLDSRQAAIIQRLLERNTPISAGALGKTLGISARMVRYNLLVIESWLNDREATLAVSAHRGISITAAPDARRKLAQTLQNEEITPLFTATERTHKILFNFLTLDVPRRLVDIIAILSASTATVSRDLPQAESWLARFHLYLQRKPRLGLLLVGRESDRRHALVALLGEVFPGMALLDYCMWNKKPVAQSAVENPVMVEIFQTIAEWRLPELWRQVQHLEEDLQATFSDNDHLHLALYLGFTLQRIKQAQTVDISPEQIRDLRSDQAYQAAARLAKRSRPALPLSEAELAQLALELSALFNHVDGGGQDAMKTQASALAAHLAEDVRSQLGLKPPHPEAIQRMADHLSRSLLRLKYRMPIENPLADQVQAAFPDLWEATARAAQQLDLPAGVTLPREEVASLLMYLGMAFDLMQRGEERHTPRVVVACPTGGVTVWMLVQRLKQELPEVEIVDVVPLRRLNGMRLENIDAIISTASFAFRDVPVISVTPLMDADEITRIRQKLNTRASV